MAALAIYEEYWLEFLFRLPAVPLSQITQCSEILARQDESYANVLDYPGVK